MAPVEVGTIERVSDGSKLLPPFISFGMFLAEASNVEEDAEALAALEEEGAGRVTLAVYADLDEESDALSAVRVWPSPRQMRLVTHTCAPRRPSCL